MYNICFANFRGGARPARPPLNPSLVVYSFLAWLITVYNDAFRTFTFSMQQSVSFLHDQKNQDNSFNFRFQIGNDRQSKRLLANLGRILLFHFFFFFWIKTGIRDFLLDIYSAYKSFVRTAALGLEFSGSNDIVLILEYCTINQ